SVTPEELSPKCLRRQLLEYCIRPEVPQDVAEKLDLAELEQVASTADRTRVPPPPPFESWLEIDVYLQVRRRGYRVLPQHVFAGYKIDLVVSGTSARQAIECNDEVWHGQGRYDADMARQRQLERCGWRFWRIRGGAFYRNPGAALQPLWELLARQGIRPQSDNELIPSDAIPAAGRAPEPTNPEPDAAPLPKPRKKASRRRGDEA